MEITQSPIKEVKCTHAGQYHAYGDSFYEYEIHLNDGVTFDTEDILPYCFSEISKRKVQSRAEWQKACGDMGKYFSGYYEIVKTPYGFKYTVCSPYTD
jgi:hypothetical protein